MWIYEYRKFDHSGFLPVGPYDSQEEAYEAMKDYADRFGDDRPGAQGNR